MSDKRAMAADRTKPSEKPLKDGYSVLVGGMDERSWATELAQFSDANLNQTWACSSSRGGDFTTLSLRKNGEVVAAALVRIWALPLLRGGYASVFRGPLCCRKAQEKQVEHFVQAIRALRNEFVCRRGMRLRVAPCACGDAAWDLQSILIQEGFKALPEDVEKTIVMDLAEEPEQLIANMRNEWRRKLRTAEREQLHVVEGRSGKHFDTFLEAFREMIERKKFVERIDVNQYRAMQEHLSEEERMHVILCYDDEVLCYGAIFSMMGECAVYLFGATTNAGLTRKGSYAAHWYAIQKMRQMGIRWYDLGGVDSEKNRGSWYFKSDLAGTRRPVVILPGTWEAKAGGAAEGFFSTGQRIRRMAKQLQLKARARLREKAVK